MVIILRLGLRQERLSYLQSQFTLIGKDSKHSCQVLDQQLGLLLAPGRLSDALGISKFQVNFTLQGMCLT